MPHSAPRPRIDSYGKPLPELADVRQQSLVEHPTNAEQRRYFLALVEETYRVVLRRGWFGEVRISFSVVDGVVQPDMRAGLDRIWRAPKE